MKNLLPYILGLALGATVMGFVTFSRLPSAEPAPTPDVIGSGNYKVCTTTRVAVSASTSTVVLAANEARRSATIVAASGTITYVKRGLTAASTTGLPLTLNGSLFFDENNDPYVGVVTAIGDGVSTSTIQAEQCQ